VTPPRRPALPDATAFAALAATFVIDSWGRPMLAGRADASTVAALSARLAVLETARPIDEENEWLLRTLGPDGNAITITMPWRLAEPPNRRYRRFVGHRLEIFGFRSACPDPSGPVVALRGALFEEGRFDLDIQVCYARAWRDDGPIYGELFWTPSRGRLWQSGGSSNPPSAHERRKINAALAVLDLGSTHGQGGRTPTPWHAKVDKIAVAVLKWYRAHQEAGRYVNVEEIGREEMGQATGKGLSAINKHMARHPVVHNEDVWQRMHELLGAEKSAN
jgi:hypothetical protein